MVSTTQWLTERTLKETHSGVMVRSILEIAE